MASSGSSGRFTPKKSDQPRVASDGGRPGIEGRTDKADKTSTTTTTAQPAYKSSGRYTAPVAREYRESPKWVPILMFTLLILGLLTIIANYMNLLPGDASNWYLLLGLGFITGGFITATQLR